MQIVFWSLWMLASNLRRYLNLSTSVFPIFEITEFLCSGPLWLSTGSEQMVSRTVIFSNDFGMNMSD
jgi:hypothetical protein